MNFVDELPNSYQKVFRLAVLEGLSQILIATQLNIAPHSSSSQLHRANEKRYWQTITSFGLSA